MTVKLRVGVLFGGQSAEHDISLLSACNIVNALDKKKYDLTLIGIDKRGQWYVQEPLSLLPHQQPQKLMVTTHLNEWMTLVPSHNQNHTLLMGLMTKEQMTVIDVIFPVLHGPLGEDGAIQGLLKLANVPFVGSDVLSSAICMDKDISKRLAREAGIPVAKFICLRLHELPTLSEKKIIAAVGLPCFVKPANQGSSIGIQKVKSEKELKAAIAHAFQFDTKIIIEEAIVGREIECAVLGNRNPIASLPGEIIPHTEFYSFEAKYSDIDAADVLPVADLSPDMVKKVQAMAIHLFNVLECDGMARVDFFLTAKGELFFNEVNTIPGFTRISQYPKMWEASGVSYSELLDKLITLALEKFDERQTLKMGE